MSPSDPPRVQPNPPPATSVQTMGLAAVLIALGAVVAAHLRTRRKPEDVRRPGAS